MIPEEEIAGLLAEADHAEQTGANGGKVLLTPEYTRHLVWLLRKKGREAISRPRETVWQEEGEDDSVHGCRRWGPVNLDDKELDDGLPLLIEDGVVAWHSLESAEYVRRCLSAALQRLYERRGLPDPIARVREALTDVCWQFGGRTMVGGKRAITTNGLSDLEFAFDVLGWDNPHFVTEGGCAEPGCERWSEGGCTTPDGYRFLCSEHLHAALKALRDRGGAVSIYRRR